jgi:hypothetical protein
LLENGTCTIPKLDLGTNILSENLETYRKRKHSPDSGSTPTSRNGENPRKAAAKRSLRRQSEEGQGTSKLDDTFVSVEVEQGGENLERLRCTYVGALAANVWCKGEKGRKKWKGRRGKCEGIARVLLERYRIEIEKYVIYTCRFLHS